MGPRSAHLALLKRADSVSFPLRLPRVPQLAEYGAYDEDSVYTADQVADLVHFAAIRGIKIVPEIDVPRHAANGWQFGEVEGLGRLALCVNELSPRCRGGICGHLNPVNDNLYDILEQVYADLADLFTSDIVHMGADEVRHRKCRSRETLAVQVTCSGGLPMLASERRGPGLANGERADRY